MSPKLRIYLIEKSVEIVRDRKEKLTAINIANEFNDLVKLMDIPIIEENTITYTIIE
ncbi:hypothetical protein ACI6Q2_13605 [Chitinophagaceae bacterium LWZ2-11]